MKAKKCDRRYKRMCIACRKMFMKEELLRFVKSQDGKISADFTGVINGRGSYVCKAADCWQMVVKKHLLNKFLRGKAAEEVYNELKLQENKSE